MEKKISKANGAADISGLDISGIEATLEIRDLKGEVLRYDDGRPFTITVVSSDSPEFVNLAKQQQDRRTQQAIRTRQPSSAAMQESDAIELLVAVTRKWQLILEGAEPESRAENFRMAYKKYPRLRQQVDEFLGNPANFSKG